LAHRKPQLLEQGLSTVKVVPSLDRPARKIYQVTEAGRQELQAWIERQGVSDASMKAFVMRLLLTDAFPHTKLVAQLEKRRAQVSAHRIALEANYPVLDRDSNSGQCMTLDYGLALATAELAWLDGTLARLTQRLPSEESG
jgi:PadR family transcriptional regulator AphA